MRGNSIYMQFVALAMLLLLASSCKKPAVDTNTGKYYMKFNANGTAKEYRTAGTVDNYKDSVTINGKKVYVYGLASVLLGSNYLPAETMSLGLYDVKALTTGSTYKESDLAIGLQPAAIMIYDDHPGTYPRNSIGLFDPTTLSYPTVKRDLIVTITALTATTISGTFSGTVYREKASGDPDLNDKLSITSGEFFLGIK